MCQKLNEVSNIYKYELALRLYNALQYATETRMASLDSQTKHLALPRCVFASLPSRRRRPGRHLRLDVQVVPRPILLATGGMCSTQTLHEKTNPFPLPPKPFSAEGPLDRSLARARFFLLLPTKSAPFSRSVSLGYITRNFRL